MRGKNAGRFVEDDDAGAAETTFRIPTFCCSPKARSPA